MSDLALSAGMRWSGLSVLGREGARMVFTIVVARLIGPEAFGIVAQALVFVAIVALLLDQGFSSALIQRPTFAPDLPGAVMSVNLAVGVVLAAITLAIASSWADFMNTSELTLVLVCLSPILVIRSACVTPRALLLRTMAFRKIGIIDITAALIGGAIGVVAAVLGAGYWALVVQIVSTDVVMLLTFIVVGAGLWPNLRLSRLHDIAAFSGRAFAAGIVTAIARNIDNLLVGRFQGAESLAFYALGYRLLLLPVQLLSTTIGGVLFPAFSRLAHDLPAIRAEMSRATRALAAVALPGMALVAAAAPQLVRLVFGDDWEPAIRIVQVLAIAGGLQTVYNPSTVPLVLGLGHAKLNLRYALFTTAVAIAGIVAGIPFSPLAVAIGYATATVVLLPVEWVIRRHLLELSVIGQIRSLMPGVHVALWMGGSYTAVAAVAGDDRLALLLGVPVSVAVGIAVLRLAHRAQLAELLHIVNRVLGRPRTELVSA